MAHRFGSLACVLAVIAAMVPACGGSDGDGGGSGDGGSDGATASGSGGANSAVEGGVTSVGAGGTSSASSSATGSSSSSSATGSSSSSSSSSGSGGSGTASGAGGAAAISPAGFGAPCESDADCGDLTCLTADADEFQLTDTLFGSVARGFCTLACADDPAVCAELNLDSVCAGFSETNAYCLQPCTFGPADSTALDPNKCNGRGDFACQEIILSTTATCTQDATCGAGGFCSGTCFVPGDVCLPHCNSDADCPDGKICQMSGIFFQTPVSVVINSVGLCVDEPFGLEPGSECDPEATTAQDACAGICLPAVLDSAGALALSTCVESCTVGAEPSCGTGEVDGRAAICQPFFTSDGAGDVGGCFRFCDCSADCGGIEECIQIQDDAGNPTSVEGKPGACAYPLDADGQPLVYTATNEPVVLLDTCP